MYLINPKKLQIVRKNPLYDGSYIVCDELHSDGSQKKQLGEYEGNIREVFARFVNDGTIKKEGWVEVSNQEIPKALKEASEKLKRGEVYYGTT